MEDYQIKVKNSLILNKYTIPSSSLEILIFVLATLQLVGEAIGNSNLIHLKPIPVILMILASKFSFKCDSNITRGLCLGLIGDLCLMQTGFLLFQIGAVFFLLGQLFYIAAFTKNYKSQSPSMENQTRLPHLATISVFSILLINSFMLWEYLPNKTLFFMYGIILSSMAASSFYRLQIKENNRYWMGILGSIAFMSSDYLIAYSKFRGQQSNMGGAMIMLLYYAGQFMIIKGNNQAELRTD